MRSLHRARRMPRRPGFTLIELLVVMGVIAMLSVLTLVSVRALSGGARLALATNTVLNTLENARSLAIRESAYVMVAFRPHILDNGEQAVQAITARWTGESPPADAQCFGAPVGVDMYVPVPDAPVRDLESGIHVAGPNYAGLFRSVEDDDAWISQTDLRLARNGVVAAGPVVAILYAPNGSVINNIPESDSLNAWVDFDQDRIQTIGGQAFIYDDIMPSMPCDDFFDTYAVMSQPDEEPFVAVVPFIAVYDHADARDTMDGSDWANFTQREIELSQYIDQQVTPIYFNRYTGVAMR